LLGVPEEILEFHIESCHEFILVENKLNVAGKESVGKACVYKLRIEIGGSCNSDGLLEARSLAGCSQWPSAQPQTGPAAVHFAAEESYPGSKTTGL
jgi:hypothetical protein